MPHASHEFVVRLKLHKLPAYVIAQEAGVNPTVLSKLINGIEPTKLMDSRIIAVGRILGLVPADCFEGKSSKESAKCEVS